MNMPRPSMLAIWLNPSQEQSYGWCQAQVTAGVPAGRADHATLLAAIHAGAAGAARQLRQLDPIEFLRVPDVLPDPRGVDHDSGRC